MNWWFENTLSSTGDVNGFVPFVSINGCVLTTFLLSLSFWLKHPFGFKVPFGDRKQSM